MQHLSFNIVFQISSYIILGMNEQLLTEVPEVAIDIPDTSALLSLSADDEIRLHQETMNFINGNESEIQSEIV